MMRGGMRGTRAWRLLAIACLVLVSAPSADAATRRAFLSRLWAARGLDASAKDGAAAMISSGLVGDVPSDLSRPVTRREAMRWCVQSLGLAFEADVLADAPAPFTDAHALSRFERGCAFVGVHMRPPLLARADAFHGAQRLTDRDMEALLQRVSRAAQGLTLDVELVPLGGMTLRIHRDGVPTGVPKWRVFADGLKEEEAAGAARRALAAKGFDLSAVRSNDGWALRSQLMEDYVAVRRLTALIEARGLTPRMLPSVANADPSIRPRYWALLTIDPAEWRLSPVASDGGPRALATLSEIVEASGAEAALNAGFFAVTSGGRGYPIGALRAGGETLSAPHPGRGALGWNDENEAMFGPLAASGGEIAGPTGEDWSSMACVVQAGPLLLDDGRPVGGDEGFSSSVVSLRHPRSAVGLTEEGEWAFLIVDGRNGLHATGATLSELTEILLSCGVSHALNLDGGGSTGLIVGGRAYGSPSEGKERPISYAIGASRRRDR